MAPINEKEIYAYLEAWEKGLITREEFRSFLGLANLAYTLPAPSKPYGMVVKPAFYEGPQYNGFAQDDIRDKGY